MSAKINKARDEFDPAFKVIRPSIIFRDNSKCVKCSYEQSLEVHHVNGYEDCSPENLRTLCYYCHGVAPMGAEYWKWEEVGVDGWSHCINFITSKFPNFDRSELKSILEAVEDYRRFYRIADAADARKRMKEKTGRCEGRKPFGDRPGEPEALEFMRQYRTAGQTFANVAVALNQSKHKTRTGKTWIGAVVCKILRRA